MYLKIRIRGPNKHNEVVNKSGEGEVDALSIPELLDRVVKRTESGDIIKFIEVRNSKEINNGK